ncbi:MAG TPA: metallophosphoesterase [Chthoniobacterales bacterium]|nr:metallophosphoesterase [Chthoniobacterales bacterium]
MKSKTIVISDLHIGSGQLDDCDDEIEDCLVRFLHECSSEDLSVELIINGDFLDFVQAEPWQGADFESEHEGLPLCFTEEQSKGKFEAIVASHRPVFTALGTFLAANADNILVIMPGNHDVDFFWGAVRALFIETVGQQDAAVRARIHFKLEQWYRPRSSPEVLIEHGHQYDPNNRFFIETNEPNSVGNDKVTKPVWSAQSPPIFRDHAGVSRLYECIGTRFLIQFMNKLDAKYPFVDNVKPFSRFLRIFGISAFNPRYKLLTPAASLWQMLRYLVKEGINSPSSLLSLDRPKENFGPSALLESVIDPMTDAEITSFVAKLNGRGFPFDLPPKMFVKDPRRAERLMTFLSENTDLAEELEQVKAPTLGLAPGTLSLGKGFFMDETALLNEAAQNLLNEGVANYVIMGHTHEAVVSARYLNTGCWIRYYQFGGTEDMRSWDVLKENSYALFPYVLRYAEIVPSQAPQAKVFSEKTS